jgi:hypothetical protein
MAVFKILVQNKTRQTIKGTITPPISWMVSGIFHDTVKTQISGTISGTTYKLSENYLQTNSGVVLVPTTISGVISEEKEVEVSGVISGVLTDAVGSVTQVVEIPGFMFLKDKNTDLDWQTSSRVTLKDKLVSLYKVHASNCFLPVHIMDEEIQIALDECRKL